MRKKIPLGRGEARMNTFDFLREIEYAIRDIVLASKTRYIMLRAKKLVAVNPKLEKVLTLKVGWALSYILSEYQAHGLIKILEIQQGHFIKYYVYIEDAYFEYAKQLEKQQAKQGAISNDKLDIIFFLFFQLYSLYSETAFPERYEYIYM
jgi:hypothetical protein